MATPLYDGTLDGLPALSIRAPWFAYILATGPQRKRHENRLWGAARAPRYRGPLLIHASKWWGLQEIAEDVEYTTAALGDGAKHVGIDPDFRNLAALHEHRGCLIGVCDLADVVIRPKDPENGWLTRFDPADERADKHIALVLDNPRLLPYPIPCRGMLGLFRPRGLPAHTTGGVAA